VFKVICLSRTQCYLSQQPAGGTENYHFKYSLIHIWGEIPRHSVRRQATNKHNRPWHPTTNYSVQRRKKFNLGTSPNYTHFSMSLTATNIAPSRSTLSRHNLQTDLSYLPTSVRPLTSLTFLAVQRQRFIFQSSVAWAYLLTYCTLWFDILTYTFWKHSIRCLTSELYTQTIHLRQPTPLTTTFSILLPQIIYVPHTY
jgi:hypothetical protein